MSIIEILGVASSLSLLAGWRLYLTILATGVAMRLGWLELPQQLAMLDALASPWVIGLAALGTLAEFFADKVAWLDSAWDGLHSIIRPVGGALLALAVVDAADPAWQVVVFLLGGGAALMSHAGKASARAVINTSPEPVSNIVASGTEDVATIGLLALAIANPIAALVVAAIVAAVSLALLWAAARLLRKLFARQPERGV
jgi:hypothetical protein